jgi:hypothetical protein
MSRYRPQGILAVCLGLAAAACEAPELATDLRPAGDPEVLATLTLNPITFVEEAVQCKYVNGVRDEKGPGFVFGAQICPDEEADFTPVRLDARTSVGPWGLRVMFDELLDADRVETLICDDVPDIGEICAGSLAETKPVTIKCGTDNTEVGYYFLDDPETEDEDESRLTASYYVPNGNNTTYPLGPSLFISPNPWELVFPTGSTCTLTLNGDVVHDKDGNAPPDSDRVITAKIADLALETVDPADADDPADRAALAPTIAAAAFVFNADLDDSTVDAEAFELRDADGELIAADVFVDAYNASSDAIYVTSSDIFTPGEYTATMKSTEVGEVNGGTFTTSEESTRFSVLFGRLGQSSGTDFSPTGNVTISFNNTIDAASLDTSLGGADLELFTTTAAGTPSTQPVAGTVALSGSGTGIVIDPTDELALGTYVVRIKAGAEVADTDGNSAKFANPLATTYNVLLKVRTTVPANSGTLVANGSFDIVYSGSLDAASISADEFELIDLMTNTPVPFTFTQQTLGASGGQAAHPNDIIRIKPNANLTVGRRYRVAMKGGASLTNVPPAGFRAVTRTFPTTTRWEFTATAIP